MSTPLVLITTNPNDYRRYQSGQCTDHVQTENGRALTAAEVELLRTNPQAFYGNSDSPEAA